MSIAYHAVKTYGFEKLGRFNATTVLTGRVGAVRVGVVITQQKGSTDGDAVAFRCDVPDGFLTDHVSRAVQTSDDVWRIASDAAETAIRPE